MNGIDTWQDLSTLAITIAISTLRMVAAFAVIPVFTDEIVPPFLRAAIYGSIGLAVSAVHPVDALFALPYVTVLALLAKEVLLGVAIGFVFGLFLWAFEAAGEAIDIQIGTAQAQIMDPLSGHEVTLFGEFLGRLANYLFMTLGGLSYFVGILLKSYAVWPVGEALPGLRRDGIAVLADPVADTFVLIVVLAAPFLIVCLLIDTSMGLINRFAERLNVFFLSNSIKALVAVLLMLLVLPLLAERLERTLDMNVDEGLPSVERWLR